VLPWSSGRMPEWWDWPAFALGLGIMIPVSAWLYDEWRNR